MTTRVLIRGRQQIRETKDNMTTKAGKVEGRGHSHGMQAASAAGRDTEADPPPQPPEEHSPGDLQHRKIINLCYF